MTFSTEKLDSTESRDIGQGGCGTAAMDWRERAPGATEDWEEGFQAEAARDQARTISRMAARRAAAVLNN